MLAPLASIHGHTSSVLSHRAVETWTVDNQSMTPMGFNTAGKTLQHAHSTPLHVDTEVVQHLTMTRCLTHTGVRYTTSAC
ncbi:hypothetical protein CCUS01_03619 [Colletotrichum cuscutae]|uniref:Uncharacterized protein n=1 Tax=Colletotrichum cuscutae TaxID=1209917 RepID=A0AAI9Y571_9PEZI|nr:hypothetical protein CCUS01_03619 [Colletotrichum cuscutae]